MNRKGKTFFSRIKSPQPTHRKEVFLHGRFQSHATKLASEKNLSLPLVDIFIGSDEAAAFTNLDSLEQSFQLAVQQQVMQRIKGTGYTPPNETNHKSISVLWMLR